MRGHLRHRAGRGADYWELEVEAGRDLVTGRRRRVVRSFRGNKREAERALAELVTEVNRGRGRGTSATFGDLFERWMELISPNRSPATVAEYRRVAEKRILPAIGRVELRRLDASDLDRWYQRLRADGLGGGSIRKIHAIVRAALEQAVRWSWLPTNPAARCTLPRATKGTVRPPTPEELARLIAAAGDVGDGALAVWLRLDAVTGARRGELCALRWSDVDLDGGELLIERALVGHGRGELIEKDTKTHAARRIALDRATVALLAGHISRMRDRAGALDIEYLANAFVFSDAADGGEPWRPDRVTRAFDRLCVKEVVDGVRLHDLRHFAATSLLAAGVDVRTAAGRLGHANASTTLDIYSHFVMARDREAADLLGDLVK